ncbi:hypothetical protein NDU88_006574 [Pleurodeles waltl]|uniref:Integrase core domain containing protein n=1 Tax=Pleurodeles waltl TaxID=8319 RepID=A0AAV7NVI0_PLEWA|nr:hypothetical protein NDU88_006574 [Pleurodeles waltl]
MKVLPQDRLSVTKLGCTKIDKPRAAGTGAQEVVALGEQRNSPDTLLVATLAEHTQKFHDIMNAVLDIKTTLEPKIDALRVDMGHLREYHKKLKGRVEATENTVSDMRPSVVDAASHISDLQKEETQLRQRENQDVSRQQPRAVPSREQAAKERAHVVEEMEPRARSPPPPVMSGEQLDADVPDLDDEQMRAILGGGLLVTPQTAEDEL